MTAREKFIRPGYRAFAAAIDSLGKDLTSLCASPSQRSLVRAHRAFASAIRAWGKVEALTFGPVADDNRRERIFFWPDRRNLGQRQVLSLLKKQDASALEPGGLARKSVAVQGLGALEIVLHSEGSAQLAEQGAATFRCQYAQAIALNLATIAGEIQDGWAEGGTFSKLWLSAGPNNARYLSGKETTMELVKAFEDGLETVRDRRIAPVIGFGPNRLRREQPVLRLSKLSMPLILANIEGLRDLFEKGGLSAAYVRSYPGHEAEMKSNMASVMSEFGFALNAARRLAKDPDPFARKDIVQQLNPIGFPLKSIRTVGGGLLKEAAGLSMGFNASDGD